MPIIEFECKCGERLEKLIPMREVTPGLTTPCEYCGEAAPRVLYSRTLEPHLYGNPAGYAKPSPTKRFSTKLAHSRGNRDSMG